MSEESELQAVRERIDRLDEQVEALISERAAAALEIARIKQAYGAAETADQFYRPEREVAVLQRVKQRNHGPLSDEEMVRLFRELMSACLALQQPLTVAYLGPEGTYTQAAANKHFGHSVQTRPLGSIGEVFREVESGEAHFGVVPVENSTEGVVSHTLDLFMNSPLYICGEVALRIHHYLLGVGERLEGVRRVYSHQQSLAQCRAWLDTHLPKAQRIALASNAEAARVVRDDAQAAAIASEAAAEMYRLGIMAKNIEDQPENTTRFLVIGRQAAARSGKDKTSLLLSTRNEAGGLYRLLRPLVEHGISMTRIESRPSRRGMWDYVFFVDAQGHIEDDNMREALRELEREAGMYKFLGSYPCAVL